MSTRSAVAIASTAPSTSERDTLRAVSSTLTWSAAMADSNGALVEAEQRLGLRLALRPARAGTPRARPAWSSGKPSKPSACEKRTTVEDDVLARRASSSAVWKATSSRWSTTYCATSFWERENSSKRLEMYAERVWWPWAAGRHGGGLGHGPAGFRRRPARILPRLDGAPDHPPRRPRPARPRRPRRRARLLHGDLPRGRVGAEGVTTAVRAGQPLALARAARVRGIHFQTHPGQGKLVRCARGRVWDVVVDLRRGSPTFGEWEGVRARRRHGAPAVDPGRLRPRLLRALRRGRLRLQVHELLRPGDGGGHPLRRPRGRHRVAAADGRAAASPARPRRAAAGGGRRTRCRSRCEPGRPLRPVSPTGVLHLGNLRTALLAWLFARSAGARFLVRMEDLDEGRVARAVRRRAARRPRRHRARLGRRGRVPVRARPRLRGRRSSAALRRLLRVLLHAGGDPRGGVGAARAAARGRLPGTCRA